MITIDFETDPIEDHPNYPPKPVGVAIKWDGELAIYLAWGHPTGNNCTKEQASKILKECYDSEQDWLFHNARFDLAVMIKFFPEVLSFDDWASNPLRFHDTMYLLFLYDPLAPSLSLKPSSERLLGLPPEEQDAVRQWLVDHGVVSSANTKSWGAHIGKAPGDLVGIYAGGDVDRTHGLLMLLYGDVTAAGMGPAYDRERRLAPVLNRNEGEGIRVDVERLGRDLSRYQQAFDRVSFEIKDTLNNFTINLDSGVELAEAIRASGMGVGEDEWPKTPTGKLSTAREALHASITDKRLFQLLSYRGALKTSLSTFLEPWYRKALANGGRLHPSWNQVKGDQYGAKTGRLSCSNPNLQNIPNEFPEEVPAGYPPLPIMRVYILPDEGEVFVSADFHSQEIRMLGHFAGGAIQQVYKDNPAADIHQVAADLITDATGLSLNRKHTKITSFSILYGAGVGTMAQRMGVPMNEAGNIKRAYLKTLRGVKDFMDAVESVAANKQRVESWGGRLLRAPDPVVQKDGRVWNKDYVLLNYLIQGSSADQTKQAIINYDATRKHGRFLATVHDEICISVPVQHLATEVALLKAAMEGGEFEIPMRATVSIGPNMADTEDYV